MRIGIVSMFANELVLAQKFCEQGIKFADVFLVAQHRSVDGSSAVVGAYTQPELIDQNGYPQAEVMTRLVNRAFSMGCEYVLPLDFDEFLPFESRDELEEQLDLMSGLSHRVYWKNLAPEIMGEETDLLGIVHSAHDRASYPKSIVSRRDFYGQGLSVSQGNHYILGGDGRPVDSQAAQWPLLHIPVQGAWHLAQKKLVGGSNIVASKSLRRGAMHWLDGALSVMTEREALRGLAFDYGDTQCSPGTHAPATVPNPLVRLSGDIGDEKLAALRSISHYLPEIVDSFSRGQSYIKSEVAYQKLMVTLSSIKQRLTR
jgi:hypothetical protein